MRFSQRDLQDSDITPKLQLSLSCQTLDKAPGRNVLGELPGTGEEGEIVVIGGHIDSWDVGVGKYRTQNKYGT